MREDVTIDHQQVRCPNASTLGFGQWQARYGDFVTYKEHTADGNYNTRYARVLGRVVYAPACGETKPFRNWLCVAAIADTLDFGYERWINPDRRDHD